MMKKIILFCFCALLLSCLTVDAKVAFIGATALTEGGTGALDAIECDDILNDNTDRAIATGDVCIVVDSNKDFYMYRYNSDGADSETNPDIIVPDDRADCTTGQWELIDSFSTARSANPLDIYRDLNCTDSDDNVYWDVD